MGNLSYETTQGDLELLFSEAGHVVEVFLPDDRATGRPRGFAFVEFTEASAAEQAVEKFDGQQLNDRSLRVSVAEERRQRSPNFSDGGQSGRPQGPKRFKPKGSRRNIRARKRGG